MLNYYLHISQLIYMELKVTSFRFSLTNIFRLVGILSYVFLIFQLVSICMA